MGTPISKTAMAINALADLLIHGIKPTPDVLYALGIDTKILQATYDDIKQHLPQMDGFVALEVAVGGRYNHEFTQDWDQLVEEAGLTGVRVCRFDVPDFNQPAKPLLLNLSDDDIEIFLTRNGEWIIWDGGNPSRQCQFIKARTVPAMLRSLQPLITRKRFLSKTSPQMLLTGGLHRLLLNSIYAKQHRLTPQIVTEKRITQIKQSSGLSS